MAMASIKLSRFLFVFVLLFAVGGSLISSAASEAIVAEKEQEQEQAIVMVTDEILHAHRFAEVLGNSALVRRFARFALRFGKVYKSVNELHHRFAAFVENVELIRRTNRMNLTYTLGLNHFADQTWEEFKKMHLLSGPQNCSATKGNHILRGNSLPKKKDWRKAGIVGPVKSQGSCGSCWTFSTTGALECAHMQATGKMVLLSEQQLVDCAGGFNNFGCNGGLPSQAFEYIKFNGGLDTEDAYPYTGKDGTCNFNANAVGATVYNVVNITEAAENELKDAVGLVRPVSVAFQVIPEFRLYKSGVFTSTKCLDKPETVNHAVLAVGYDVDENGIPYWIIKNSWGTSFGLDGYFHMEMGKNMCGIAACSSYPIVPEGVDVQV